VADRRRLLLAAVPLAAALAAVALDPGLLAGWLVAFVFWSGLPVGALCLLLMLRLVPGTWREALLPPTRALLPLLPLAAVAALPVLAGVGALYPWATEDPGGGFRGLWLTPWFFIVRSVVFFLVAGIFVLTGTRSRGAAALGLILLVPLDTIVATDWLMSLDPAFHSSGFGLYILSIQVTMALASLVLLRRPGPHAHPPVLGALLFGALLLWAYFAFMQYFIIWSDDLPPLVAWYERRGAPPWSAVAWLSAVLQFAPLLMLLFPPFRRSGTWVRRLSAAILAGKALELAWLVLPETAPVLPAVIVALAAGFGLGAAALMLRRERAS
jgi:hypothetical protein